MARIRTDFPYETRREDVWIPLPDGTQLYARIWRPISEEPVPALLEYLPYRLSDWTAPRDWQRHPGTRATVTPPYGWTCAATATPPACPATSTTRRSWPTGSPS